MESASTSKLRPKSRWFLPRTLGRLMSVVALSALGLGVSTLESLDATAGVDQLLLARVERVTVGADVDTQLAHGRTRLERVAA